MNNLHETLIKTYKDNRHSSFTQIAKTCKCSKFEARCILEIYKIFRCNLDNSLVIKEIQDSYSDVDDKAVEILGNKLEIPTTTIYKFVQYLKKRNLKKVPSFTYIKVQEGDKYLIKKDGVTIYETQFEAMATKHIRNLTYGQND